MLERIISLTHKCNQKCLFCFIEETRVFAPDIENVKKQIAAAGKDGALNITFSGGEPSLTGELLLEAISFARGLGVFQNVGIQTNGILFDNPGRVADLKASGLNHAFVPLHSHIPALSDYLTQAEGTWKRTVGALQLLNSSQIPVSLNTVINALNFRYLTGYLDFVSKELCFIEKLNLSVVVPSGRATQNKWIVPRYGELAPFIQQAHLQCREKGIGSINPLCGMPACYLPGMEDITMEYSLVPEINEARLAVDANVKNALAGKTKSPLCGECAHNGRCLGVFRSYHEIHGFQDIHFDSGILG